MTRHTIPGPPWGTPVLLQRALLALGTLVSLVLAAGAGGHWH